SQFFMNTPTTSWPSRLRSHAATDESTPPDRPSAMRCFAVMRVAPAKGARYGPGPDASGSVPTGPALATGPPRLRSQARGARRSAGPKQEGQGERAALPLLPSSLVGAATRSRGFFCVLQRVLTLRRGRYFLGRTLLRLERSRFGRRGRRKVRRLRLRVRCILLPLRGLGLLVGSLFV